MKYLVAFAFVAVVAMAAARPEDKYTTKYDGVDVDEILKSDRLFNNYFKCLMDKGKCTPDGSELKRVLPDALKTNCSKCSEKQKTGTEHVIKFLIDNKPAQWEALQNKYDPEHIYTTMFRDEAKNHGINV
uniref:Chemosensory protein n=1 Tax=Bradysia odoriphaga TaxID=1564500 RepID=A0A1X9H816_9DIPT|nr:chemosensory protein [Bradysia odoriphaga]AWC08461.1 chemosensory protein 1 [Bradysia odoriphaga]